MYADNDAGKGKPSPRRAGRHMQYVKQPQRLLQLSLALLEVKGMEPLLGFRPACCVCRCFVSHFQFHSYKVAAHSAVAGEMPMCQAAPGRGRRRKPQEAILIFFATCSWPPVLVNLSILACML
jgi:hypothetical protein